MPENVCVRCPDCNRGAITILIRESDERDEYGYCNFCYLIAAPRWIADTIDNIDNIRLLSKEEVIEGSRKAFEYDKDIRPPIPYLYNAQAWHDRCKKYKKQMIARYEHHQTIEEESE